MRSTNEGSEQRCRSTVGPRGGSGGKASSQEHTEVPPVPQTRSRTRTSMGLDGVREAGRAAKAQGKEVRFTAPLHHITPKLLRDSFMHLKRDAAAGVDGVKWREYEEELDERIGSLWDAVQSGRYRALPSRRVYIRKGRRQTRPTWHRDTGKQDRLASRGDDSHGDLRSGLPWLLVWLSDPAQPAPSAGRSGRGHHEQARELGARRGHPGVPRHCRSRMDDAVSRASDRRQPSPATDRWRHRTRAQDGRAGGYPARGGAHCCWRISTCTISLA